MKNKIKKIGALILSLSMLIPFVEIPKVNAAEDCTTHLQSWMFLDSATLYPGQYNFFERVYDINNTRGANSQHQFGHENYTRFPYAFPEVETGETLTITSLSENTFNINNFIGSNSSVNSLEGFWNQLKTIKKTTGSPEYLYSYDNNSVNGKIFVTSSDYSGNYDDQAILIHGPWSSFDENGNAIDNQWTSIDFNNMDYLVSHSFQKVLTKDQLNSIKFNISLKQASYDGNSDRYYATGKLFTPDYLTSVINNQSDIIQDTNNRGRYIPIQINRSIGSYVSNMTDDNRVSTLKNLMNNIVIGAKATDGNNVTYCVYGTYDNNTKTLTNNFENFRSTGYSCFQDANGSSTSGSTKGTVVREEIAKDLIDFYVSYTKSGDNYTFNGSDSVYYWPAVLNVEYKVCKNSTSEEWTLAYDGNAKGVANVPDSESAQAGTNISVTKEKPVLDGYTFVKWCENSNGSGKCYEAGDTVEYPGSPTTKTLYAQWGQVGNEDNKKTGIVSYVIGFISVGLIAGAVYYLVKKKNLFKQI